MLFIGVALAAVVARDGREKLLLWRFQLSALYGFAVLAKLNETFLGGDVLTAAVFDAPVWLTSLGPPPLWLLLASGVTLVVAEGLLAVTPWVPRLRRGGTWLAVALHGGALLLVTDSVSVALRLLILGGAAVALHASSAGLLGSAPDRKLNAGGR